MDRAMAADNLQAIESARSATRSMLDDGWFPLQLWGAIVLMSAPFTQIAGGDAVGWFWVPATFVGVFFTFRYFKLRSQSTGLVSRHKTAYIATSISIGLGSMVLGIAGDGGMLSAYGPVFVVAAGLAVFAALDRSSLLAVSATTMTLLGVLLIAFEPARATLWSAIAEGLILIVTGVVAMRR
jgi:hypothetical protein